MVDFDWENEDLRTQSRLWTLGVLLSKLFQPSDKHWCSHCRWWHQESTLLLLQSLNGQGGFVSPSPNRIWKKQRQSVDRWSKFRCVSNNTKTRKNYRSTMPQEFGTRPKRIRTQQRIFRQLCQTLQCKNPSAPSARFLACADDTVVIRAIPSDLLPRHHLQAAKSPRPTETRAKCLGAPWFSHHWSSEKDRIWWNPIGKSESTVLFFFGGVLYCVCG